MPETTEPRNPFRWRWYPAIYVVFFGGLMGAFLSEPYNAGVYLLTLFFGVAAIVMLYLFVVEGQRRTDSERLRDLNTIVEKWLDPHHPKDDAVGHRAVDDLLAELGADLDRP